FRSEHKPISAGRGAGWSVVGYGGQEIQRRGQEKLGRVAGRSGRRGGLHRISLEDELAGRRYYWIDSANLEARGRGDNFDAFVITNDAANFSVGANLMLLLM